MYPALLLASAAPVVANEVISSSPRGQVDHNVATELAVTPSSRMEVAPRSHLVNFAIRPLVPLARVVLLPS